MGFDCLIGSDLTIRYYVRTLIDSDSLVNVQILREISMATYVMLALTELNI